MPWRKSEIAQALLDAAPDATVVTGDEGVIVYANKLAVTTFGYRVDELVGRPIEILVPVAGRARHADLRGAFVMDGRAHRMAADVGDLQARRKDGTTFPAAISLSRVETPYGALMTATVRDVTERRAMVDALRESEERFRFLAENSTDIVSKIRLAPELVCEYMSPAFERYTGYTPEDAYADPTVLMRIIDADDTADLRHKFELDPHELGGRHLDKVTHKDGRVFWMERNGRVLQDGAKTVLVAHTRDLTDRIQAEAALKRSEERFRSVFEDSPVGMSLRSVTGAVPGRFIDVNDALCDLLGYSRSALLRLDPAELVVEDTDSIEAATMSALVQGTLTRARGEVELERADGTRVWARRTLSLVRDDAGDPLFLLSHVEDVTAARAAEHNLRRMALHDPLTGLANRLLLMDRLAGRLGDLARHQGLVGLLYADLDRFKTINDRHGHEAGDMVLTTIAERLTATIREGDTAARIGGDEFVVLCADLHSERDAIHLAERISAAVRSPIEYAGVSIEISPSFGIALTRSSRQDGEDLLRAADSAMYRAKQRGRNRHEVYDDALRTVADERRSTEARLRQALGQDRLVLQYLPTVDLITGLPTSMEAVLFVADSARGLVSHSEYAEIAEEAGLAIPIGRWVVEEAARQAAHWHSLVDSVPSIAVTLTSQQVHHVDVRSMIVDAARSSGARPEWLSVKMSERVFVDATGAAMADLRALRGSGVRLTIDGFGTGYVNIADLRRFPIDTVKIDASFVRGLAGDNDDTAIVAALTDLGHKLGLTVVASGIDTAQQLEHLCALTCDEGQGNHISPPLDGPSATKLIESREPLITPPGSDPDLETFQP